jgi:hypothetical protein
MALQGTGVRITLNDKLLRRIAANIERYERLEAQAGYYTGATYGDGTPVSAVAAFHEFGTVNMPQRSFMRSALQERRPQLAKITADATGNVMRGGDPVKEFSRVAKAIAWAMYDKLRTATDWAEPLAPRTIARKGHAIVLFEVGKLRDELIWRVRDRGRIVAQGHAKNVGGIA